MGHAGILLCCELPVKCVQPPTDMINTIIKELEASLKIAATSEERVDALNHAAWELRFGDAHTAMQWADEALTESRQVGYVKGIAEALRNRGFCFWKKNEFEKALNESQRALQIFEEIEDIGGQISVLNTLGNIHYKLGNHKAALESYQKTLVLNQVVGDQRGEANSLNNMGGIYASLKDYRSALEFHEKSLKIRVAIQDRVGEANSLNHLASVYSYLGDPKRGLEYYEKSLKIRISIGDRKGEAAALQSLGNLHYNFGHYEKALDCYQRVLKYKQDIGDKQAEAYLLNSIGNIFSQMGNLERALMCHQRGLELQQDTGDKQGEAETLMRLGKIFTKQQNNAKASEHFKRALSLADALKSKPSSPSRPLPTEKSGLPNTLDRAQESGFAQAQKTVDETSAHIGQEKKPSEALFDESDYLMLEKHEQAKLLSRDDEQKMSSDLKETPTSAMADVTVTTPKKKRGRKPHIGDKPKKITYYLKNLVLEKKLKLLSVETGRDLSALTTEAIELLLQKYNM